MFFDTGERNIVVGFILAFVLLIGAWIYFENRYENECHDKGGHIITKYSPGYKSVNTTQFCISSDGRILDE